MHPLTLDLPRIEQALLSQAELEHYLDLTTGNVLTVIPGDPPPGADEKYDVQPDRYLAIEPLPQVQALALREAFLFGLHDPHAHTLLSHALAGRKPLRTFDYQLENLPRAREAWLAFQAQQVRELALEWLQDNGLEQVRHPSAESFRPRGERSPARH
ncbi:UPF0158 family protein [Pseudomonas benzenivorans]|uniref:Uncharacterized protein n=1 Tax=Pseudomonas benzenivorans TaxID=556533 RepID=A0ABY5HBK3_9PSED|nr:UPF0158 family protein [Pseudomonas benzenivorans]UTW09578.1 hypothetical protein KDW96_09850 [Pseudomonas benzenivorans]